MDQQEPRPAYKNPNDTPLIIRVVKRIMCTGECEVKAPSDAAMKAAESRQKGVITGFGHDYLQR